jgi:predicted MPP superfamily phosphohydrolase
MSESDRTFRWLHLSDFHVGKDGYGQRKLFDYIHKDVKDRLETSTPDAVFITGDLANKGLKSEYAQFNDEFLGPLLDILPDIIERIFLIPGNHDVNRSQARAVSSYDVLARVPEFLDPTEQGAFERLAIRPRFQDYIDADITITGGGTHWLASAAGSAYSIMKVRGRSIGVASVNTAWFSYREDDRHRLTPGKSILEEALGKIAGTDLRIVLGHHPLNWLTDVDLGPVKKMLGRHAALYLCGHLHNASSDYDDSAPGALLTLQAGAAFQAREDEQWINRLHYCEVNFDEATVSVEPKSWSRENQEWRLDGSSFAEHYRQGDMWVFPLPRPAEARSAPLASGKPARKTLKAPLGWREIDADYLAEQTSIETDERLLSYFDGRSPSWGDALSNRIPRRSIVRRLKQKLEEESSQKLPCVILVTGAAGEGKTTALLQAAADIASASDAWSVIWHEDTGSPFPPNWIQSIPIRGKYLIVSDDAELISTRVFDAVRELHSSGRSDVHFLLCSRDTDWRGTGGESFTWGVHCRFVTERLLGISPDDAEAVVRSWSVLGAKGLGSLVGVPLDAAISRLVDAAQSEVESAHEGSLFGALLQVRHATDLREHIYTLLQKLKKYQPSGVNLLDAFALIASMHAQGLLILTKEVLAVALGVESKDLRRRVLSPLGDEAAIATTGRHVFTRHQAIAKVALDLLADRFSTDTDELYQKLLEAALAAGTSGTFIPNFDQWRFLGSHFAERGDEVLGIRLARIALTTEPANPFIIDNLSRMYREANQPELAVELFRGMSLERPTRSSFFEWGLAEFTAGSLAVGVFLVAYSISDQCGPQAVPREQLRIGLSRLASGFQALAESFGLDSYAAAARAAEQLVKPLEHKSSKESLLQGPRLQAGDIQAAFKHLREGAHDAFDQREYRDCAGVETEGSLTFGLGSRLIKI